ncbi:uncharacterized protein LOC133796433 [Humulus lupulus]|uniref:uncharacterized protein LOC133796433 n=1 Tax=Humulus lupulus TaxID=3486 RepID=UPI002B403B2E|nr:uncharacterized protein LOC133796433 [Humulus lupulus]
MTTAYTTSSRSLASSLSFSMRRPADLRPQALPADLTCFQLISLIDMQTYPENCKYLDGLHDITRMMVHFGKPLAHVKAFYTVFQTTCLECVTTSFHDCNRWHDNCGVRARE